MQDFRNLHVWRRAHELTLRTYRITQDFPAQERYGLTTQMRRSASSIPSNIAEGCGRGSDADFSRFLQISFGSSSELDYQVLLAHDLGYLSAEHASEIADEIIQIKRMLTGLLAQLR